MIEQWSVEADGEEGVRIATKSLVRFRLCPGSSCSATHAAGCYVIDMATFMEAYFEAVRQIDEVNCANYLNGQCNCDNDDQDDNFDEDILCLSAAQPLQRR